MSVSSLDEKLLMAKMMVLPASFEYLSPPEGFSLSKDFLSYFNKSRRAFQSGISFATSAQKAGLWLGCKKWQYSCTTT